MEGEAGPTETFETHPHLALRLLTLFCIICSGSGLSRQQWVLIRTADGTVIASNYTWGDAAVTLTADFSKFFEDHFCDSPAAWRHSNPNGPLQKAHDGLTQWARGGRGCDPAQMNKNLWYTPHYGCPEPPPGKRYTCGSHTDYYCKAWGCETLALGWDPGAGQDKHIILYRDPSKKPGFGWNNNCALDSCNPTIVTVLNPADPEWIRGRTWGIRLYVSGTDPGTFFTVRQLPISNGPFLKGMGRGLPRKPTSIPQPVSATLKTHQPTTSPTKPTEKAEEKLNSAQKVTQMEEQPVIRPQRPQETNQENQRTYALLDKVFPFLNSTQPDLTDSCWLCLSPHPPYYVGIGANTSQGGDLAPTFITLSQDYSHEEEALQHCLTEGTLTIEDFQGNGTCYVFGHYNPAQSDYRNRCLTTRNMTHSSSKNPGLLKAPEGIWFICLQGMYRCLPPISYPEFCVTGYIIPQVYLYAGNPDFVLPFRTREKRTPLLIPIIATVGILGSTALGAAALIRGELELRQLSQTFSKDLSLLQDQGAYLERQVDSLAEVALQNRRGLDLLFLRQGGLCAALGETCCFYANHSGIIRDSIKVLTQRLAEREKPEELTWYAGIYKMSPWLTTLISSISGPLLIILLCLTCGPIVINKLTSFVKERIETVKLMVLAQPYTILPPEEDDSRI